MPLARMAVRINPPARRLARTLIRLPIADNDTVQRTVESAKAGTARGFPETGFEQVPVQPELIADIQRPPFYTRGVEKGRCFGIRGLQAGEERLMIELVMPHDILQVGQHELLMIARAGIGAGSR